MPAATRPLLASYSSLGILDAGCIEDCGHFPISSRVAYVHFNVLDTLDVKEVEFILHAAAGIFQQGPTSAICDHL